MAKSSNISRRGSRRESARGGAKGGSNGGQLDIIASRDTGYPELKAKRTFSGNGPTPGPLFGHEIPNPHGK